MIEKLNRLTCGSTREGLGSSGSEVMQAGGQAGGTAQERPSRSSYRLEGVRGHTSKVGEVSVFLF